MELAKDREVLIVDRLPNNSRAKSKKVSSFLAVSLVLCALIFFVFICLKFWFVSTYYQPYKLIIITSRNDSFIEVDPNFIVLPKDNSTPITQTKVTESPACSSVPDIEKFDCYPNTPVTEEQCVSVGCCYQEAHQDEPAIFNSYYPPLSTPYCYYPRDYVGYRLKNATVLDDNAGLEISAQLERVLPSSFPNDIPLLNLHIRSIDENSLQIKIYDPQLQRHEAPLNKEVVYKNVTKEKLFYDVHLLPNGTLSVQRKSSGAIVFETNLQQLVFADQFLQLSTILATPFVYGLGEHYDHLLKNVNWTRTPLFNKDNAPKPGLLLYGTHPFYLALEKDTSCHGIFFLNSNSMDFVLQPTPALTFRPIGGIIDMFIFLGPTPGNVIEQYTELVSHPFMPPYWSLGFHLCRFEYNTLNETRKVWQRNRDAGLPFDTQWNDIDYMKDHNDFTYDTVSFKGLPEFVEELHHVGMHYVIIIDPGIPNSEKPGTYPPYDDGLKMNLFVRNNTGDIFIGKVWNAFNTVYPDFSHPNATEYWIQQFKLFHDIVPFDGAWIDMNEPSNFYDGEVYGCPDTPLDNPPYVPGGIEPLRTHTLCMSAKHYNSSHYNEHNLYALKEAIATYHAMSNITSKKRPFIISRASFAGQGKWSGHWSGDIGSNWEDLRYSVYDLLKFSLYGMPMMGSDICGFNGDTTMELCARWSALGAFYPFSRNHNSDKQKDQDPAGLGGVVLAAAKNTLTTRYELLPYLYYLFYRSHVYGETVARPLFFEFVNDSNTYSVDEQFLWGPSLMIMPALYQGVKTIDVYFPQDTWYDYYTGEKLNFGGKIVTLDAPLDNINLALRGGYVIPHQHSNTTTTESRKNKFYLYAVLGENGKAFGELYWDDGESIGSYENNLYNLIHFEIQQNVFMSNVTHAGYSVKMDLDFVKVCGVPSPPKEAMFNGHSVKFTFDKYNCLKVVTETSLLDSFVIEWE